MNCIISIEKLWWQVPQTFFFCLFALSVVYFCADQGGLCSHSAAEQMNLSHELSRLWIVFPLHHPRFWVGCQQAVTDVDMESNCFCYLDQNREPFLYILIMSVDNSGQTRVKQQMIVMLIWCWVSYFHCLSV